MFVEDAHCASHYKSGNMLAAAVSLQDERENVLHKSSFSDWLIPGSAQSVHPASHTAQLITQATPAPA